MMILINKFHAQFLCEDVFETVKKLSFNALMRCSDISRENMQEDER
jgi:hypothetical protein